MAPGCPDPALGLFIIHDRLEASPLNLSAEHIPIPCSLLELVLDRYTLAREPGSDAHNMELEELIGYLKNADDLNLSPWMSIVNQTEAMGDPSIPTQEQSALLRWLGDALGNWEQQFPLEKPLALKVRQLMPLAGALAVVDPDFLVPGAHPLHQLLDSIQARAIGWQSHLDRVGKILEKQVAVAVNDALEWFNDNTVDLAAIFAEFSAAADRDESRAKRMAQRVIEAERGKIKTAAAKLEAATMINTALHNYRVPAEIGNFVKGHWYSSAQLLLLKFGSDSEQWRQMSATTDTLFDSLQPLDEAEDERRQYVFDAVTQLPKEMRRWLLSLHHDTDAVNEAMALVEYAHLRILRRQTLELEKIPPIPTAGEVGAEMNPQFSSIMQHWQEGQWFIVEQDDGTPLRAQMVLKVEATQQLLFTNMAGIQVLNLNYGEFIDLYDNDKVTPLYSGASFSLCLASSAGIQSAEMLKAFIQSQPAIKLDTENTPATAGDNTQQQEPQAESGLELQPAPEPEPELETAPEDPKPEPETEELETEELETEELESEPEAEEPETELDLDLDLDLKQELEPAASSIQDAADAEGEIGFLADEAVKLDSTVVAPPDNGEASECEEETLSTQQNEGAQHGQQEAPEPPLEREPEPRSEPELEEQEISVNLPMGTWLGFHDGETPLMAKLAVHDPENDVFIFVNRQGVKLREVSTSALVDLIDNGLVDILETSSNFREEVSLTRKNRDS